MSSENQNSASYADPSNDAIKERLIQLNQIAIAQMTSLVKNANLKKMQ